MKAISLRIVDFRQFDNTSFMIGDCLTAVAGNNGTGKSTVLGVLANSSQLKGYKTYLDKPYKGEFSELFSATPEHDPSGQKMFLEYEERGEKRTVVFRTGWQNKQTRFRIIPKRVGDDGKETESKVVSPMIYLGLSRLYPVGEALDESVVQKGQRWQDESDRDWFENNYTKILSMRDGIDSLSRLDIKGSQKRGVGIETNAYGPTANSAGQDNLGQILMAVLSFKTLHKQMGDEWDGGLILIDEVDATLHPAAQIRLVRLLYKEAKKNRFQVIFTTHSTVVLEWLAERTLHNPVDRPGSIEVVYLTDANRKLVAKRNPAWHTMESDLLVSTAGLTSAKIGVFSEDPEARWLIQQLLMELYPELLQHITFVETSFGCGQLMDLYREDFLYLKDRIIVFDGDVDMVEIDEKIPASLRVSARNITFLPGPKRPETVLYDYLHESDSEDPVWDALQRYDVSWRIIDENGPDSGLYSGDTDERVRHKNWFREYQGRFEAIRLLRYWIGAHEDEAQEFLESFVNAFNAVASRTSAIEMPMPKHLSDG